MPKQRTAYRTCPLCEATCGLEIQLEDEQITAIRGDANDVFSRGYVCPKGTTLADLHNDPDRLRTPLVRRGGVLEEASWDEAFEAIEQGLMPLLEKHGRDAVAVYLGNPNVHNLGGAFYVRPLMKALRTRNMFSASTLDQMPKHVSSGFLFGNPDTIPVPDLDRTDYLLMLGANPFESNGSLCTAPDFPGRLKALRKRGGKLVVVDPRRTRTTRIADEHLFIRPGTDALLLLAMAATLFEEGLVSLDHLADSVEGLEAISEHLADWTPERVATKCGIAADRIRGLTREFAAAPSAVAYGRIGTSTTEFGTLASWAVDLLNVLTGNLDRPGGAMFPRSSLSRDPGTPGGRGFQTGRWHSRAKNLPEVRGEFPIATLVDEIETPGEGQVRALVTIAGNPVLSAPEGDRLDAAIAGLDFMVSIDIYCNETTRHADVILPALSPLERSHFDAAFSTLAVHNVSRYSPPVFEATGPDESEILARFALVAGGAGAKADPGQLDEMIVRGMFESAVGNEHSPLHGRDLDTLVASAKHRPGPERILDFLLRTGPNGDQYAEGPDAEGLSLEVLEANPHGVDLGPLEPRLPNLLSTPSGKIELAAAPIIEDLARLRVSLEAGPDEGLLLVGRRHVRSNNSWMHNIKTLVSGRNRCSMWIHPDDAERMSVANGAGAQVRSRVGEIEVVIEVTEDVMPGVVSLPHGWGHGLAGSRMKTAAAHPGVNSNRLTDGQALDLPSGTVALNAIPVSIHPL